MSRLVFVLLLQMNLSVQWAVLHPGPFVPFTDWNSLPTKPDPSLSSGLDDKPGWINAILIGDHIVCCCDHYAVRPDPLQSYCWRDAHWYGVRGVEVCDYKKVSLPSGATPSAIRDANFPRCEYYGEYMMLETYGKGLVLIQGKPWIQFKMPVTAVRHGKYLPLKLWKESIVQWK